MTEKTEAAVLPEMPSAPGFTHLFVDTPGLRTHVAVIGEGEPVLMLHGLPQHWWQWRSIGAALAARYRVVCPDLRGAGWTVFDAPVSDRVTGMRDLRALLDAMGIERLRLVSHDWGAITATQFAYAAPERVRANVVLSIPPAFMRFGPKLLPLLSHIPRLRRHRPGTSLDYLFAARYAARPMARETIDTYLAPMRRPEIDAGISVLYKNTVIPELLKIASGRYRKERLRVPSLYLFGSKDEPLVEPLVRRLSGDTARYADHLELGTIEGAAHFMTDDAPGAVQERVLDFFERMG